MSVTTEDIAIELGRPAPTSSEDLQWSVWIDDARMLISARLGDLDDLDQTKLDYVVRQAVSSHVRQPDDATQVSVSVDDASTSRTYRSGRGRVTISDDLWNLLSPDDTNGNAFSIIPSRSASCHQPWCSLAFGALYCSCGADIAEEPLYEWAD